MSEFCKACSIDIFGEDSKDFVGITTKEAFAQGLACVVLCEGCGPIQVDPEGICISKNCLCNHH